VHGVEPNFYTSFSWKEQQMLVAKATYNRLSLCLTVSFSAFWARQTRMAGDNWLPSQPSFQHDKAGGHSSLVVLKQALSVSHHLTGHCYMQLLQVATKTSSNSWSARVLAPMWTQQMKRYGHYISAIKIVMICTDSL